MDCEIKFLDSSPVERRFKDGKVWDVIDYPFQVTER
jgi:hypothetical protein